MPNGWYDSLCAECGAPFRTRKRTQKTCSHRCGARMRERNTPSKGRKKITYPSDLVEQVRKLYGEGLSLREVANELGTTIRVLQRLMDREGIPRRTYAELNRVGSRNPNWQGGEATYSGLHQRVVRAKGRPQRCEDCGRTDGRFDWANITGDYENVDDYRRLCPTCHVRLDARRRKETGRRTIPEHLWGGA